MKHRGTEETEKRKDVSRRGAEFAELVISIISVLRSIFKSKLITVSSCSSHFPVIEFSFRQAVRRNVRQENCGQENERMNEEIQLNGHAVISALSISSFAK